MLQGNVASWTRADYEQAALDYLARLPPEHFMEATPQGTQRAITIESFAVLKVLRPGVELCNELLVQYPLNGDLGQVCPDNMAILTDAPLEPTWSFNTPFEKDITIFWVMEYVSRRNKRKDYVDNFRRYGQEMKVPYYLTFDPETKELRLNRHNGEGYEPVAANEHGRYAVPELEVEVGLLNGWTRYWFRGELIPLPGDLLRQMTAMQKELEAARQRADKEAKRAAREKRRAEKEKEQIGRAHV